MNKNSIKNRITILLFLSALLPLFLVWGISFYFAKQESYVRNDEIINANLQHSSKLFNNFIEQQLLLNKSIASIYPNNPEDQKTFLNSLQISYPWIHAIFVSDINGQQIIRSNNEKLNNIEDRDYFKKAKYSNSTSFISSISKATGLPSIISGSPINKNNHFSGVIGITAGLNQINEASNYSFMKTGFSFVLNKKGEVILHPSIGKNGTASLEKHPLYIAISQEKAEFIPNTSFSFENKKFIGTAKKFYDGNIILITNIEESEVNEPISKMNILYFVILLVSIIFSYIIAVIFAGKFSKSIEKLTEISDMITQGNFKKDWNDFNNEPKEIQELAMSVKKLSLAVQIAIQKFIKESKEKK